MSQYRDHLPQLSDARFVTDGGLETTLIFEKGFDLPQFAAFDLLRRPGGYAVLRDYYHPYIRLARENEADFILESPTWRASRDWGDKLGYSAGDLRELNRVSIALMSDIRRRQETSRTRMVISGCVGPRGDGYQAQNRMTAEQAEAYHADQIRTFSQTEADLVSAFTLNYVEEAVGIVRAAQRARIPSVIGFTTETDGRLPSGQALGEAVMEVDRLTNGGPVYYLINCAHPVHFAHVLDPAERWVERIRAIRPNASTQCHAELDEAEELDPGDPRDLGARCAELAKRVPHLNIFGGCCGTGVRHVAQICHAGALNN